jgi:hypothetical protein
MDKRIEIIFGKAKPFDIESAVLLDSTNRICIYKYEGKPVVLTRGKIFCSSPAEIIEIPKSDGAEEFSTEEHILDFLMNGRVDKRLEKQREIYETYKNPSKITRSTSKIFDKRRSLVNVIVN